MRELIRRHFVLGGEGEPRREMLLRGPRTDVGADLGE